MDEQQEQQEEQQEQPPDNIAEVEQRAKLQGWVPKESFKGNPDLWRPADKWVERADEMMPILKATNRKLEDNLLTVQDELTQTKDTLKRMGKMQDKHAENLYESERSKITIEKMEAVKDGDTARYAELEVREKNLAKPEPVIEEGGNDEPAQKMHPAAQRFFNENSGWWEKDQEITDYAMWYGEKLAKEKDPVAANGNEVAFFDKVKDKLQATFPDKFQNPNRNTQIIDEPDTRGSDTNHPGPKGWNDLPPEAQAQCDKNTRTIQAAGSRKSTEDLKKQYIQDYFEVA